MDKNAIKKYAVWARNELIARVSQKAEQYEITATADPKADAVRGVLLTKDEKEQRAKLIGKVKEKGSNQVMEEVAYTWFNRFSALRFMEVNNYLPTRVRVFTDESGTFKPQILDEAIHMDLKGLDMEKVYALKEANDNDFLFKYLIITQCNALSEVLPGMFQKISDYTELLFPDNLLREGSVVEQMVTTIPEDNWDVSAGGQVEILGWLYQYYISEKHDAVIDPLHGKVVKKEEVPAATALFTTDWVVRYIIDNSVGRYWIERNPDSNLKNELEYFVTPKDGVIPTVNEKITPEQLTVFDPSMGSAHFGVYAFEVLEKIYTEYGYTEREAAASIVQNNLFGLDIDDRSAQIAYFAIMMKAMQYDKRFLKRGIQPHFYSIKESNDIDSFTVDYFANGNAKLKKDIQSIVDDFKDAKEYGSILQIAPVDFDALFARFDEIKNGTDINIYTQFALEQLLPVVEVAKVMSEKYVVVATNPPYLNKYDSKLKKFINERYKDYSGDLFSVFIYRNFELCRPDGYTGFMTPFVWMFIQSYEQLRKFVLNTKSIVSLIQFEYSAFEEATVPICSFILRNSNNSSNGLYFRLSNFTGGMEVQREKVLNALANKECGYYYEIEQSKLLKIPGLPIAYWISDNFLSDFEDGKQLSECATPKQGIATTDNNRFVRFWFEVKFSNIGFGERNTDEAKESGKKWFPMIKGGDYRKWYGNRLYVVNYQYDGREIKENVLKKYPYLKTPDFVVKNSKYYFRECISWSKISSARTAFRLFENGFIFSDAGMAIFTNEKNRMPLISLLNSKVCYEALKMISPTLNFESGHIERIPILDDALGGDNIELITRCINCAREDWDLSELSWDFLAHPLLMKDSTTRLKKGEVTTISEAYQDLKKRINDRFADVKNCEELLNASIIREYKLQNEIDAAEDDKDVTLCKIYDDYNDIPQELVGNQYCITKKDIIKSFISYSVGCIFGRYSLDKNGIVYSGENFDEANYPTFCADKDGILPICDDEYFDDDITGQFVRFVETVFGTNTLESNLTFIAAALGGKGAPRQIIRNYFLNDF